MQMILFQLYFNPNAQLPRDRFGPQSINAGPDLPHPGEGQVFQCPHRHRCRRPVASDDQPRYSQG